LCGNRANISDTEFRLTPHQCAASNLIWGGAGMDTGRATKALHECAEGNGLTIYVIGGSISAGGKLNQCSGNAEPPEKMCRDTSKAKTQSKGGKFQMLECKPLAWPAKLEDALNNHFPCSIGSRGGHTVINAARSAVASDYWFAHFMAARSDPNHPMNTAHVILLETSANDVEDIGDISPRQNFVPKPANQFPAAMRYTELLVRLLRGLKHKPLVMWVTAGFCCNNEYNSEHATGPLLRRYDMPYVSMAQALYPFEGLEGPANRAGYWTARTGKYNTPRADFFENVLFVRCSFLDRSFAFEAAVFDPTIAIHSLKPAQAWSNSIPFGCLLSYRCSLVHPSQH
jgi:hypothetical protein